MKPTLIENSLDIIRLLSILKGRLIIQAKAQRDRDSADQYFEDVDKCQFHMDGLQASMISHKEDEMKARQSCNGSAMANDPDNIGKIPAQMYRDFLEFYTLADSDTSKKIALDMIKIEQEKMEKSIKLFAEFLLSSHSQNL